MQKSIKKNALNFNGFPQFYQDFNRFINRQEPPVIIGITMVEYITLVSSDGFEFIISKDAAMVSGTIKNMLSSTFRETEERKIKLQEMDGRLLNKVVEYLHYNIKYKDSVDVPEFNIPTEMALELLVASDFLDV